MTGPRKIQAEPTGPGNWGRSWQVRAFFRDYLGNVESLISEPMAVIAD